MAGSREQLEFLNWRRLLYCNSPDLHNSEYNILFHIFPSANLPFKRNYPVTCLFFQTTSRMSLLPFGVMHNLEPKKTKLYMLLELVTCEGKEDPFEKPSYVLSHMYLLSLHAFYFSLPTSPLPRGVLTLFSVISSVPLCSSCHIMDCCLTPVENKLQMIVAHSLQFKFYQRGPCLFLPRIRSRLGEVFSKAMI